MKRLRTLTSLVIALVLVASSTATADLQSSADVDGDGIADSVNVSIDPSGFGTAQLLVTRGSNGQAVSIDYDSSAGGFTDSLLLTPSLDDAPGVEIILDAQHITTNEIIKIFSMSGGTLHLAGSFFAFGSDSDYRFGITCVSNAKFTGVIQHNFKYSFSKRRWKRTDKAYSWSVGYLRRTGSARVTKLKGKPKRSETRVDCG